MTTIDAPAPTPAPDAAQAEVDTDKLMQFVFRAVDEVGATLNAALVVMGDKLGYYRDLAAHGPEHAGRSWPSAPAPSEPYAREWLNAQAAGGYVDVRPGDRPLHAAARAGRRADRRGQPGVPARLLPDRARHGQRHRPASSRRPAAAPASAGTSTTPTCTSAASGSSARATTRTWSPSGCRRSTASSTSWSAGATVADVGCGHGASTILMAQAFPRSTFVGFGLPRRSRSRPPASARPRPGVCGPGAASRSRRPTAFSGHAATTW